jgi:hypothetical protein
MKLPRRAFLHLAAGAAAFPAVLRIARAQAYPSRPITMIVPFAPGGISDVMGRMMAEPLRAILVRLLTTGDKGRWGVWRAVGFGDPRRPSQRSAASEIIQSGARGRWSAKRPSVRVAPSILERRHSARSEKCQNRL